MKGVRNVRNERPLSRQKEQNGVSQGSQGRPQRSQWTGHRVLLGSKKNSLVPEIPPFIEEDKYLAEKTVEDVLRHFGKNLKEGRRRYRQFVEKGIKHGRREDLQGGGLVRSAGGDTSVLSPKRKEDRELSDQRVLGSGDFVSATLQQSERILEKKYLPKRSIEELIELVAMQTGISPEMICSRNRKQKVSEARSLVSWLAVEKTGHPAAEVARYLGISRVGVLPSVKKGHDICQKYDGQLN